MNTIKTELGYFLPITSPEGLKELRWQQTPFSERPHKQDVNQNVSCETIEQLEKYLSGELTHFSIVIDFSSWTAAMTRWFKTLTLIPYGQTTSYQGLAKQWGNVKAARAAGQACRRNPIPIIVPCHRVLKKNGSIRQYSGGSKENPTAVDNLARKQWLLSLEIGSN